MGRTSCGPATKLPKFSSVLLRCIKKSLRVAWSLLFHIDQLEKVRKVLIRPAFLIHSDLHVLCFCFKPELREGTDVAVRNGCDGHLFQCPPPFSWLSACDAKPARGSACGPGFFGCSWLGAVNICRLLARLNLYLLIALLTYLLI